MSFESEKNNQQIFWSQTYFFGKRSLTQTILLMSSMTNRISKKIQAIFYRAVIH